MSSVDDLFDIRIANEEPLSDVPDDSELPHGSKVAYACSFGAPEATYSFYRAAGEDGWMYFDEYRDAISLAIEQSVDVLNLSYGEHRGGCHGHCPVCYVTKKAIAHNITIIAAAGNKDEGRPAVFCPAIVEDVIAVSGMVAECTNSDQSGESYTIPVTDGNDDIGNQQRLCGQRGCDGSGDGVCARYLNERPWRKNVSAVGDKPDVLAPVQKMGVNDDDDGDVQVQEGTSFAAPLVTGAVAAIYSDLVSDGVDKPNPYQIRQAVIETARPLGAAADAGVMDGLNTYHKSRELLQTLADD